MINLEKINEGLESSKFLIRDVTRSFVPEKDKALFWKNRQYTSINSIVIHQTFSSYKNSSFKDIEEKNKTPGKHKILTQAMPGIVYHFGIDGNGEILKLSTEPRSLLHVVDNARHSFGVAVLGDFNGSTYTGVDVSPTISQLKSLSQLLNYLTSENCRWSISPDSVEFHTSHNRLNCPGTDIEEHVTNWKEHMLLNNIKTTYKSVKVEKNIQRYKLKPTT